MFNRFNAYGMLTEIQSNAVPANLATSANPQTRISEISEISRGVEYEKSPWDDEEVWQGLIQGGAVHVYSHVLGSWVLWVMGERERGRFQGKYPERAIYTYDELRALTEQACTPAALKLVHSAKEEFKAVVQPTKGRTR